MRLIESHIIGNGHKHWAECDRICFASKNLYNQALYRVNEHHSNTGKYKNYYTLSKELATERQVDYIELKSKVSQQTLMLLHNNWKSFFASIKDYSKNPTKYKSSPLTPKYLHKTKGRFNCVFTSQAISKTKPGFIKLSGSDILIKTTQVVKQACIVPLQNRCYKIQLVYETQEPVLSMNRNCAGIDIGLNNLATIVTNTDFKPIIFNGRPLKSINQYYNKKLSKLKSELPFYTNQKGEKKQHTQSKKIKNLTHKRNCKVDDYIHKVSRQLANTLKQADISKVIIGKNTGWKNGVNIGSRNNQKFVSIPHAKFIDMVKYKLRLLGIDTLCREESYTSKCSFLDNEEIIKHESYLGKRIKRGLFKTHSGFIWNADCNGAANILKKEIPNAFANGIEAVVVPPSVKVIFYKKK